MQFGIPNRVWPQNFEYQRLFLEFNKFDANTCLAESGLFSHAVSYNFFHLNVANGLQLIISKFIAEGVQTRPLPARKEIFVNNREEKLFLLFSFETSNPLRPRLFWNRKLFWLEDSDLCLFLSSQTLSLALLHLITVSWVIILYCRVWHSPLLRNYFLIATVNTLEWLDSIRWQVFSLSWNCKEWPIIIIIILLQISVHIWDYGF